MTEKEARAARLEAAAGWYAELQDETLAADVWQRFLAWERDPANAAAFAQIEASLSLLDRTRFARARRSQPRAWRYVGVGTATAAAVALVAVAALGGLPGGPASGPVSVPVETYATAVGERQDITLADGSSVTLNTGSRLEVAFSQSERRLKLVEGQALFEVETADRPFVVEAGGSLTTALGTEFDIRLRPEGAAITLLEGKVRVAQAGDPRRDVLSPGQRLQFTGSQVVISEIDPAAAASWKTGMIRFRDVTLAEAVEEMNRYSETNLRVDDPELAEARLSGVFPAGDQDVFVESLTLHLDIRAEREGDGFVIRPKR